MCKIDMGPADEIRRDVGCVLLRSRDAYPRTQRPAPLLGRAMCSWWHFRIVSDHEWVNPSGTCMFRPHCVSSIHQPQRTIDDMVKQNWDTQFLLMQPCKLTYVEPCRIFWERLNWHPFIPTSFPILYYLYAIDAYHSKPEFSLSSRQINIRAA
jgi:hypothetical protein